MNREQIKRKVIDDIVAKYDAEQANLVNIGLHHTTEGEIRYAAGELVEKILQSIFDSINSFLPNEKIISKVGSTDYLKKEIPDYKNNKYYENRSLLKRTIEKNKLLTKIYCKIYKFLR